MLYAEAIAFRSGITHVVGTPLGRLSPWPNPDSVVVRFATVVPAGGAKIVSFWLTRRNSNVSKSYFLKSSPPFTVNLSGTASHARSRWNRSVVFVDPCGRIRISLD